MLEIEGELEKRRNKLSWLELLEHIDSIRTESVLSTDKHEDNTTI